MSNHLNVLTPKGLSIVMHEHQDNLPLQAEIKQELHRRGLRIDHLTYYPERERDDYERGR
jgi:hypothetical protein